MLMPPFLRISPHLLIMMIILLGLSDTWGRANSQSPATIPTKPHETALRTVLEDEHGLHRYMMLVFGESLKKALQS